MFKFLKKLKIYFCCSSKCVLNDLDIELNNDRIKYYKEES